MSDTAVKTGVLEGYMSDAQGRLVPMEQVREIDQERDKLVREIVVRAKELSRELAEYKRHAMDDIKAFVDLSAERYDVKIGGNKGNITLSSYDGSMKVMIAIAEYIEFDEGLQAAKQLIDNCLRRWSEGANNNLKAVVNDAFKVDRKGRVDTKRILGLRRLEIHDDEWERAMDAISEAVQVTGSKEYIRIYERSGEDNYNQVLLDIASV